VCTYAYAQSFCHLVQDVGTNYEDTIESAGTYYYSAWTFDLPMDVYITSLDPTCSEPPQVWADLTCNPGVYDDPKIQELVQDTAKFGISVPWAMSCETTFEDGHYKHHLQLGKSYRNRLKLFGIDYNVRAYVKVVLPCGGVAHMEQDTSSMACVKDARRLALTDSTRVLANDSLNTYLFPFQDWLDQTDSVAIYWAGTEPAHIWLNANNCEFDIDVLHSWDNFIIPANSEVHLYKSYLQRGIREIQDSTGYLFAKIFSPEEGRIISRTLAPDLKGATLLKYDTPQKITASTDSFYCFPTEWNNVEWVANTRKIVTMYVHSSPEVAPVDSFKFDFRDSLRRVLIWSTPEMKELKAKASGSLLYVRFACSREKFYMTPYSASSCSVSVIRLRPGRTAKISRSQILSLYYADVEGDSLQISCVNDTAMNLQNLFIADTCQFTLRWSTGATKKRCVLYKQTARGGETWTVDSATVAGWKEKRPPVDGFYYVRGTSTGTITLTTTKLAELDPEGDDPIYPEEPVFYFANYADANGEFNWHALKEVDSLWLTDTIVYYGGGINIHSEPEGEGKYFSEFAGIDVNDTVFFTFNPTDSTLLATLVSKYVKPEDDPGTLTGMMNTIQKSTCTKILYHGQIIILRGGNAYTTTGQVIMQ